MTTSAKSSDYLNPQSAYSSPARNFRNQDYSSPGQPIASSPLLAELEYRRTPGVSDRTSRASSIRLSRELENLRWDGSQLEDTELTEDDSFFRENEYPEFRGVDEQSADVSSRQTMVRPGLARQDTAELSSYSALSKRADFILASAKRKLNLLEGDIKGARHSLMGPPRTAPPLTDSFGNNLFQNAPLRSLSERTSKNNTNESSGNILVDGRATRGHARGFSDTSVPSPRGPAVKGSLVLEHVRNRQSLGRRDSDFNNDRGLEPVIEDEALGDYENIDETNANTGTTAHEQGANTQLLRSEAEDLRNRLSLIQERVRYDAQNRRSLQGPYPDDDPPDASIAQQIRALQQSLNQQESVIQQLERAEGHESSRASDSRQEWRHILNHDHPNGEADLDNQTSSSKSKENGEEDFESVLEEQRGQKSLGQDDDDDEPALDGAHEDRADAFDYEHFILHSVLGNYSSTSRRSSSSSSRSNSTARGDAEKEQELGADQDSDAQDETAGRGLQHFDSVASFATAQQDVDDGSDDNDDAASDHEDYDDEAEGLIEQAVPHSWPMPPASNSSRQASTVFSDSSNPTPIAGEFVDVDKRNSGPLAMHGHRPSSRIFSALTGEAASKSSLLPSLSDGDQTLVYSLAEALRHAYLQLQRNPANDQRGIDWRRRVEEARRILAGET